MNPTAIQRPDAAAAAETSRSVTYLDHAATSWPKPPGVIEAMRRFLDEEAANPGRGGHRMALAAQRRIDRLRAALARLLNAPSPERIIMTMNATDALNTAILGVVEAAKRDPRFAGTRPRIVSTVIEHNAVARPLNWLEQRGEIELARVGCDERGIVSADEIIAAVDERTLLVELMHASNVTGAIQPIERVGAALRDMNHPALYLVDGAATVGLLPIDVRASNIDVLAFPGHKHLLGPTGTGALYVGPRAFDPDNAIKRISPARFGGTGGNSGEPLMPERLPHLLETGTPNTIGCAGLLAALGARDPDALRHERRLVARVMDHFQANPRVTMPGPKADGRTGIVSLLIDGWRSADLGALLDQTFDIAVRPGLLCAPMCHRALGTYPDGMLRISVGPTTTDEEVGAALDALDELLAEA